jgi:hypothetical protein
MAACAAMLAGVAAAQPVQWRVEDGGNGHWYQFETSTSAAMQWPQARAYAEANGGHLATITNAAEQRFIEQLAVAQSIRGDFWLGGFQPMNSPEPDGNWQWVDGTPWQFNAWGAVSHGTGSPPSPNDWNTSAPNEQNWLEICFRAPAVTPNGGWDDQGLDPNPPLLEWDADCNGDGIVDKGQILAGELADTNNNGIPDNASISGQPQDQASADGGSVSFTVQVATGPACSTPVTYRWQRRNPAVPDPAAPGAWFDLADDGTFANTDRPTMTVVRPGPALATGYRCKIGGGCGCEPNPGGFIYTDTVNFSIACPADFNADGGIDFGDVEAFFERWENGC